MEEYAQTLSRLENISFDKMGKWGKETNKTSDYLNNDCCVEYLTLILKASLFRSEKHQLEENCLSIADTHGAVDSGCSVHYGRRFDE